MSASRLLLPAEAGSPAAARRLVRHALRDAGRDEWVEAAELAVSELVTNAVLHAHTEVGVTVTVEDARVRVEVRDGSPVLPGTRAYDDQATTGRGMGLVATVAAEHGVLPLGEQGKVVWFVVDGPVPEQPDEALLAAFGDADWDLDGLVADTRSPAPSSAGTTCVRLLDTPSTLWLAARQHHDALLRELVLYLAEHDDVRVDLARADAARGLVSRAVQEAVDQAHEEGTARPVLPEGHPSPLPWAPDRLDLELPMAADAGPAYAALQDALDAAEDLAVRGQLLARPGLPEVVAVRDWVCEQVQSQLQGVDPRPWPGTAQARFETAVHDRDEDDPDWDVQEALASGRGVVAADDANRIVAVSEPLAAALGWRAQDLVGRRVVTLVPPRLRESHVAGFTRHLTSGEVNVLGVPLTLPVLHADGSEVTCSFLIEQAPPRDGRTLYLAWIEPVAEGG